MHLKRIKVGGFAALSQQDALFPLGLLEQRPLGDVVSVDAGHRRVAGCEDVEGAETEERQRKDQHGDNDFEAGALGLVAKSLQHDERNYGRSAP